MKYYQPKLKDNEWGQLLYSFEVYHDKKQCEDDFPDYEIIEFHDDDIDDPTFVGEIK